MIPAPLFCEMCGAANEPTHTHCFACQQPLSAERDLDPSQPANLLHGRYQLGACLGTGGYSLVYRASDLHAAGQTVAIKKITLQGLSAQASIEATETFHREVRMLSLLKHPQVPHLYEHFGDQHHWYLVLDYIEGQTLETYLETREKQGLPLQLPEIIGMILQLCSVLEYLHSRQPPVIFRDLKPGNIMRTPKGVLCLIDFGIARHYQPGLARDTQRLGSPGYAAPEQYGRTQTTPQTDVYSLGALLHFLLSGQDPSNSEPAARPLGLKARAAHPELEQLASQMRALDPGTRPTLREVVATLDALKGQRPIQNIAPGWQSASPSPRYSASAAGQQQLQKQRPLSPQWPRSISRRRMLIGLGVLTVAAGTGGLIWWKTMPLHPSLTYLGHSATIRGLTWSPDGTRIASASDNGTVLVWDTTNGNLLLSNAKNPSQGNNAKITGVAWSPDGTRIASASDNGTVLVWTLADGVTDFTYSTNPKTNITSATEVIWSPDGARIALIYNSTTIHLLDANDGSPNLIYQGHSDSIRSMAWSPDGSRIASASADATVQVWDTATGSPLFTYRHSPTKSFNGVAWSPNGTRVASTSDDHTVQVWNALDGGHVFIYQGHSASTSDVGWSADGKLIASSAVDGTAQVWTAINGELIATYSGASGLLAWSPKNKRIAIVTAGKEVQVWNVS